MEYFAKKYQVIVIGAGHAGIEAGLASARLGCETCVFTINLDWVGNMACNPSIGGRAKGHLVFEIDALGGEMGYAADMTTIQSRTLNLGKGAAVHSKRIQADRAKYRAIMKHTLETTDNLRLVQSEIVKIETENIECPVDQSATVEEVVEAPVVVAPQTFDLGVIAAVAAIVSAAGYAISKKR